MKTRFLITFVVIVAIAIMSLSAFTIYDSSTTTFVECVPPYEQVDGRCIMPSFKILLDDPIHPNDPLIVSVEKTGYYMCDEWSAKIIDTSDNSTVWEKDHPTLCVTVSPPKQQKFLYPISNENNPIVIDNVGRYLFQIDIGGESLEEEFLVANTFEGIKEPDIPVYPRFTNGVTEIINPEHSPLKYRSTNPVIDDTYLSKNVEHWNGAWRSELDIQYGIYGDDFYTEVGRLLIKNEMQHQMNDLGIVNADDDFEVFGGGMLSSLPPHIGFSAVVYATDGNYYRLEGGTFGNQVRYYRTTQLQFPDTAEELSMESLLSKPQSITIVPEDGNKARQDPITLVIHVDDNAVEFFNNTPEIIRIQDSGSGRMGEENTLSWMGPMVLPYQNATVTFDEPGLIEWDARNAPDLEDPLWWSTHAGGYIVVLSDDIDDFSREDKARIAQKMLHNSDIPITSSGSGNAEKVLKIGLDPAVSEMIPDAEEYYLQRAHQIIPFDVEIVMYE